MRRAARVVRRSFAKAGRLVPGGAKFLRSRSIILPAGRAIEWHSTRRREELLVILEGSPSLEVRGRAHRVKAQRLSRGACVFLPPKTWHRVVNRSTRRAHYIYVTAQAAR